MASEQAQSNKSRVANILRAYGQGDLQPLLDALDDEVKWDSHAPAPHYRFGGIKRRRDGVVEVLALIASEYAIQRHQVKELVAEGDTVWSLSEVSYHHIATNTPLNFVSAARWKLRGGRIVEFDSFFDSAYLLARQGRLAAE